MPPWHEPRHYAMVHAMVEADPSSMCLILKYFEARGPCVHAHSQLIGGDMEACY